MLSPGAGRTGSVVVAEGLPAKFIIDARADDALIERDGDVWN